MKRDGDIWGTKINGMCTQMLRFADDTATIADIKEEWRDMLIKMNNSFKQCNMKTNKYKTKILVCSKQILNSDIIIRNQELEII